MAALPPRFAGITRLFWLMCDQAIFALSSFILNVLFARWLSEAEYGLFAVSFSGFILFSGFHWCVFLEPLLVQSAQVTMQQRRAFIVTLAWEHLLLILLATAIGGVCDLIATDYNKPIVGDAILWAASAGSMISTLLTARRLCLVFLSAKTSAITGLFYFLAMVATGMVLDWMQWVTWYGLWLTMGGWSLICSLIILILLYRTTTPGEAYSLYEMLRFQSRYARWAVAAAINPWLRYEGVYLFLANFVSLEAVALTRSLLVLANPLGQINLAMNASWLVTFSDDHANQRRHNLLRAAIPYGLMAVTMITIVSLFPVTIVHLTFGERYESVAWLLPFVYIATSLNGMTLVLETMQKARGVLLAGYLPAIVGSIVVVACGFTLVPMFGITGGIMTILSGSSVALLTGGLLRIRFRY